MTLLQQAGTQWKRFVEVGATLFPWVGGGLLAVAFGFGLHSWLLLRQGVRAEATVTDNVPVQDSQGNVLYQTHARFRLPSGELVSFVDPIQSSQDDGPSFAAGTVVPVVYPPGKPASATIATTWRVYFFAIVLGCLGVFFLDLGLILRRFRQRKLVVQQP